jgi:transposase
LGKLNNEPIKEAALNDRVEKLERLVGKLTMENDFLKKALQNNVTPRGRKESSSNGTVLNSKASPGAAS